MKQFKVRERKLIWCKSKTDSDSLDGRRTNEMTVYGKNRFQVGLFVDVLYSQNPFDERGFYLLLISEGRRIKHKNRWIDFQK
jgi:hypothetical protein